MYNVFVNKKLLRIAKKSNISFDVEEIYSGVEQLKAIVENLESEKYSKVLLRSDKPKKVIKDFAKIAKVRVAAGGKVYNAKGEILFIFREGVWDLPKGFVEKGESLEQGAIREVEEETAVSGLKVIELIDTTYHTYRHKGKLVLKVSHWFKMSVDFEGELKPQLEEGITKAEWLDSTEVNNALENTWENIKLLF